MTLNILIRMAQRLKCYRSFKGDVSLREALKKSLNIPALKTAQTVGLNKSKEFAEGLGMTFENGVHEYCNW